MQATMETAKRPRVIYVSYDGAGEPLGQSQVVAYLERLAADCEIQLISFEKPGDDREPVAARLAAAGIDWHPLDYHRRPPVASTVFDVWRGTREIKKVAAGTDGPFILHVRSYVPALMVLRADLGHRARFIFDTRSFWPDERVEMGMMRGGGLMHRIAKHYERRFFAEADAVVTLTNASIPPIREWMGPNDAPIEVITTCADLERFRINARPDRGPRAIWAGTVGPRYDFRVGVQLAREMELPLTVLTREAELARSALDGTRAEVKTLPPAEVPAQFAPGDLGLSTMLPSFGMLASAPTRIGEYLAAGMPVAALSGVGDLDQILPENNVGVTLADSSPASVKAAAEKLRPLLQDPATPARCRRVAEEQFSLEQGVERYRQLYKRLLS
jgi:glycosyltransferase involved in cell wall biosynthesis